MPFLSTITNGHRDVEALAALGSRIVLHFARHGDTLVGVGEMGGTFVRATSDREQALTQICHLLVERDKAWLAESPEHATSDHIVRLHAGSDWISINWCRPDAATAISVALATEVIALHGVDEHRMRFGYTHHASGEELRKLHYEDGAWKVVRGAPEPWETSVRVSDERALITEGPSIPWACDGGTLTRIAHALGLPYDAHGDRFLNEIRRETIRGSLSSSPSAKRWWWF